MWPTLSYLLLDTLHGLLIRKAGDGETISHNLDDGFAILVNEIGQVQGIFLVGNLHRFFPKAFTMPSTWSMPDEN